MPVANTAQVEKDLSEAFTVQADLAARFKAYSNKAGSEGFSNLEKLFKAESESYTFHAQTHMQVLGQISSSAENLKASLLAKPGDIEFTSIYANMLDRAKEASNTPAVKSFNHSLKVEEQQQEFFREALAALEQGKDFRAEETIDFYICPICGHIHIGKPQDGFHCPICRCPGPKYRLMQ